MNSFSRYKHIDLLKAIGVVFVVFYHCSFYSFNILSGDILCYIRFFLRTILSTCAPIFFFINGYLLFSKEIDLKKHYKKTLKYFIVMIMWGAIELFVLQFIKQESLSIFEFIIGLLQLKSGWINHLWFISALLAIYLLFPLIKVVYDKNKKVFIISTLMFFYLLLDVQQSTKYFLAYYLFLILAKQSCHIIFLEG